MAQKILIAMDDSENAMRAAEFVSKSFGIDHEITLFSVVPDAEAICDMNSPELTPHFMSQKNAFCSIEDKNKELVGQAVSIAKEILLKAGFEDENITTKVEKKKNGVARDIVQEAESGYDILVLGRRGHSAIVELFLGGVGHKVLSLAKNVSVLFVN